MCSSLFVFTPKRDFEQMMQCNPLVKKMSLHVYLVPQVVVFFYPQSVNKHTTRCHKVCGTVVDPKYNDTGDLQLLLLVWGRGMSEF